MFIADMPLVKDNFWEPYEAINLCIEIEKICPQHGCHVALTGGLLYKEGRRKDADILFYNASTGSKQKIEINIDGLFVDLERKLHIYLQDPTTTWRWVVKATYQQKTIDFFFPDNGKKHGYVYPAPQVQNWTIKP